MKKVVFFLIMLFSFSLYSHAQSSYTEVVYLKNGSTIRGVIVEQVPNSSLKIKTADGNLFVFQYSEIEKITKEEIVATSSLDAYRLKKQARNTLRGYKGFVDAGYTFDLDHYRYYNLNRFEISTSHGYQFNNYLFLGGGVALNYFTDDETAAVPIFVNFRVNFINKKITPFGDIKLGYVAGNDISGAYSSIAIGVRISVKKKSAVNFCLEYSAQNYDEINRHSYLTYYEYTAHNGLGLKVGFEF